jgi:hypothetical protein
VKIAYPLQDEVGAIQHVMTLQGDAEIGLSSPFASPRMMVLLSVKDCRS